MIWACKCIANKLSPLLRENSERSLRRCSVGYLAVSIIIAGDSTMLHDSVISDYP